MSNEQPGNPVTIESKKTRSWDWLWPTIVAAVIIKTFGLVGGLASILSYYGLKSKLGHWGAVAASGVLGIAVALGLAAIIRSQV
jgi:hypothetical protein